MINVLLVPGDVVRVVKGITTGRSGPISRMQRQAMGDRKVILWVEVAPGESHAYHAEELDFVSYAPPKKGTPR